MTFCRFSSSDSPPCISTSAMPGVFQRSRRKSRLGAAHTSAYTIKEPLMRLLPAFVLTVVLSLVGSPAARAQGVVMQKQLSLGLAKAIAEAALGECKARGFATSVAVVDRAGQVMVLLRDEGASAQTAEMSRRKAYTARMFRTITMEFQKRA